MHSILNCWELELICGQKSTPSFLRNDSMNDPAIMPSCISKYTNRCSIKGVCSHAAATTFTPTIPTPSSSTLVIIYSIVFLSSTKLASSIPSHILVEVWNVKPLKHHVQLWLWIYNCNNIPMSFCAKDMLDYLWDLTQYQSVVKVGALADLVIGWITLFSKHHCMAPWWCTYASAKMLGLQSIQLNGASFITGFWGEEWRYSWLENKGNSSNSGEGSVINDAIGSPPKNGYGNSSSGKDKFLPLPTSIKPINPTHLDMKPLNYDLMLVPKIQVGQIAFVEVGNNLVQVVDTNNPSRVVCFS